jgi:hypothetical protein
MANNPNEKRNGASAKSLQEAEAQAVREKMARLRAMRLAHEANLPAAKQTSVMRSAPRKTDRKKPGKSVPLADWLSTQEESGRRK